MPFTRAFCYITCRVPSKGPLLSRFPSQSTHRKRCPISRAPFQLSLRVSGEWIPHDTQQGPCGERCLSPEPLQSPVNEPPTIFPSGAPHGERCPSTVPSSPCPSGSPQRICPDRAPTKQDAPFLEPSNYFLKFPVNGLPQVLQQAPTERDTHLQSFLLHLSLKVPSK